MRWQDWLDIAWGNEEQKRQIRAKRSRKAFFMRLVKAAKEHGWDIFINRVYYTTWRHVLPQGVVAGFTVKDQYGELVNPEDFGVDMSVDLFGLGGS